MKLTDSLDSEKQNNPHAEELKELLRASVTVLQANEILTWIDCGTLLGAVRDEGFIPWEKDIDLGSWDADYAQSTKGKIAVELKKSGYSVAVYPTFMNIRKGPICADVKFYRLSNNYAIEPKWKSVNHLGTFLMIWANVLQVPFHTRSSDVKSFSGGLIILLLNVMSFFLPRSVRQSLAKLVRNRFQVRHADDITEAVPAKFLKKTVEMSLCNVTVRAPAEMDAYLSYRYGPEWRIPQPEWVTEIDDRSVTGRPKFI